MYKGLKISVVMPAYNEEKYIFKAVEEFKHIPEVDEIIVVNNNSTDRTAELAKNAEAIVVDEGRQGYGYASHKALISATGELVFITEPDGTFRAGDIYKFLPYSTEFDAVFGTRTAKSCIWKGANMGIFLRYGNAFVAKLLEYLHNGPCLTDVGCTFKMLRKEVIKKITPYLIVGGSHFSPNLMIALLRAGMRCVEIPVHYRRRQGQSKITGNFKRAFKLGIKMIIFIIQYRFKRIPRLNSTISEKILVEIEGRT
jgi:glycosyltransferase involved in cell wall biosynthesis